MNAAMRQSLSVILGWLVTLCIPIALVGTSVRLILVPTFLSIEYAMPGFPADPYGFDTEARLRWATHTWQYLIAPTPPTYLMDLTFDDGLPVFNSRELSHMADVKAVVGAVLTAWLSALVIMSLASLVLWLIRDPSSLRAAFRRGGWLTIGIAAIIGAVLAVGAFADPEVFWDFFTVFHGLFFVGDSWLFAYSDTLIRLFPIRFWQDTFLIAVAFVLSAGLALALGIRDSHAQGRANA